MECPPGGRRCAIGKIENCVAGGANAVVMVAIARDGMNNLLTQLKAKNIPVIDAINGVSSKDTAVRVLTSPRDDDTATEVSDLCDELKDVDGITQVVSLDSITGPGFQISNRRNSANPATAVCHVTGVQR